MNSGIVFRERRERMGWSLEDAAKATKIKPMYLRAIEDGDISVFPGETYFKGYMRTYAQILSIDVNQLPDFNASLLNTVINGTLPEILIEESKPSLLCLIISILLVIIIYNCWVLIYN